MGWPPGGTLCFSGEVWEPRSFLDTARAVDWWFLQDHPSARVNLRTPELYVLVRLHTGRLWTTLHGSDVTEYSARRPAHDHVNAH